MASTIKVKRSAVQGKAPTTGNLETGELALNTRDGRLYSKGTQVFEVGANNHSLYVGTGGATFANGAFSLPTSDGTADQVIKTNGSGTLSWVDQSSSTNAFPFYVNGSQVSTVLISEGQFPFYDTFGNADNIGAAPSGLSTINNINDVTVTTPSSGQVLKYNGSVWVNTTESLSVTLSGANNSAVIPYGTTAQRDASPDTGYFRYNVTTGSAEIYDGSAWGAVGGGGGATGGGSDDVFYENSANVTASYTLTSGKNAMSAGPITVDTGVTVTIPTGSRWVVV